MNTATIPDTEYVSLRQAAATFDVSRATIWNWTRQRGLPKFKLGQKTFFKRADIHKLIESGRAA
jgi:excisionase family DNA binding protein